MPGADGTTLAHAVEGRPVVPEEDRFRFVEDRQVAEIRTWLRGWRSSRAGERTPRPPSRWSAPLGK
ncbi:MAG: hypothetical protein R2702_10175 [Acidimicrobiales bacterium]